MVTVPSQNSEDNNVIYEPNVLVDKFPKSDKKDQAFYVTTRKAAIVQANEKEGENSLFKYDLKRLSNEVKTDKGLQYAIGRFNNNLKSVLENDGNADELKALNIARNHYEILGLDKSSQAGLEAKLNALESGDDEEIINRVSPVLNEVLAETQAVLGDLLVRLSELSAMDLGESDEEKTYKMLVDTQIFTVENKIAQGIGVNLKDEDSENMINEIKQAMQNADAIGDLNFIEETGLRAVKATMDMQRYHYAHKLNSTLINNRLNLKDLGIQTDADSVKLAEMLLNRVKIALLGDLNYISFGEMMNDLICVENLGETGVIGMYNASAVVQALVQYEREHRCECDDDLTCTCYKTKGNKILVLGDGRGQVAEANKLQQLMNAQNVKTVFSAPAFLTRNNERVSTNVDDDWADDLDINNLF